MDHLSRKLSSNTLVAAISEFHRSRNALITRREAVNQNLGRERRRCRRLTAAVIFAFGCFCFQPVSSQQQQDPLTQNGGSILAMAGKECVAVAVDRRFGSGPALINLSTRHIFAPSPTVMVAFSGLEGDVQSLQKELSAQISSRIDLNILQDFDTSTSSTQSSSAISPRAMAFLTSHILYSCRRSPYYVEPIVVGLETQTEGGICNSDRSSMRRVYVPYLCGMDLIGARSKSASFVCAGSATKSMYGTAESLWEPDLSADRLLEVCGKAFLSALERDCISGYGAAIYLITRDGIVEHELLVRND